MSTNDDENATPEKLKVHPEKPMRTRHHSEETRRKLSIAQKGKRNLFAVFIQQFCFQALN